MLTAVNANAVREYCLKSDKGVEKTIFLIGVLDAFTRAHIRDSATSYVATKDEEGGDVKAKAQVNVAAMEIETVRFGLRGWKNFTGEAGTQVQCLAEMRPTPAGPRKGLTDESLMLLHPAWISELAEEINSANNLSETDVKN